MLRDLTTAASAVVLCLVLASGAALAQSSQAPAPSGSQGAGSQGASSQGAASSNIDKPRGIQAVQSATVALRFVNVEPADTLSSRLVGSNVYNNQNETIGEIEDLVIENGKTIKAVVIGIGGFLGMGERYVTVDPATLVLHRESDGNIRVMASTNKESLKNAPAFNYHKKR
ncbi:PRC-barrel domain-containing protein [Bradyrhizobium sp. P5_C11_2]